MFRLSREVRFSINSAPDEQLQHPPANSFGGFPALCGAGSYYTVRATLSGELDPVCHYLVNIREFDVVVRAALPGIERAARAAALQPSQVLRMLCDALAARFKTGLATVELGLTPQLSLTVQMQEPSMMRLSQKFEFCAAHRLHNPTLSDDENRRLFGKCNNALGHGHNYEVQVTVTATPREGALPVDLPALERIVNETVIRRFDHKHLNLEVPEFAQLLPSVENIARVIYRLLKPGVAATGDGATLTAVTVWETPKTWCEYSE